MGSPVLRVGLGTGTIQCPSMEIEAGISPSSSSDKSLGKVGLKSSSESGYPQRWASAGTAALTHVST